MRVKAAITVASVLFAVGGGCSRPWQASNADVAPLNSPPFGQTRSSNSFDLPSQNPDEWAGFVTEPIGPCVGTATAACVGGRTQGQNDHHSGPGRLSIAAGSSISGHVEAAATTRCNHASADVWLWHLADMVADSLNVPAFRGKADIFNSLRNLMATLSIRQPEDRSSRDDSSLHQ